MRERAVQMRESTIRFEEQNLKLLKQTRAVQEEQAQIQLKIAQARLSQLEENIDDEREISKLSLENSKANLLRVQSTLNNQMERLGWTTIVAPMSGIVINLEIEEGEIVTSGRSAFSQSPPLMQIVDLTQMVVKTFINEVDMEKLSLKQKAEVRLRAYPEKVYSGEVREISPSGQARDNIIYFEVVIAVLGSPEELRPGMTADVDIIVLDKKDVLMVPIETVKTERTGRNREHYVMLVSGDKSGDASDADSESGKGVKTLVEVGEQNDMSIEILSGLSEGDRVLAQSLGMAAGPPGGRRR
jgi:HlyD family secretion protein